MKFLLILVLLFALYLIAKRIMARAPKMPRAEAAKLLGVGTDADANAIVEAHRRLISKVHPDAGGNAELAARINEARDVLLKK